MREKGGAAVGQKKGEQGLYNIRAGKKECSARSRRLMKRKKGRIYYSRSKGCGR